MSEADFSWFCISSSSDDTRRTRCMMNRTKRTLSYDWHIFRKKSRDTIYFWYLYRFIDCETWQDCFECFCKHRFSTPWRPRHYDIVSSSRSYLKSSFRMFLSDDVLHIVCIYFLFIKKVLKWERFNFLKRSFSLKKIKKLSQRINSIDLYTRDNWCFTGIGFWNKYTFISLISGSYSRWQHTINTSEVSIEWEFS